MLKFDHHIHTSRHSPDSLIEPRVLIMRARALELDGVVITEHDYQWTPEELAGLAAEAGGLKVFAGAEVSAREGHFLVYGLPDLEEAPCGIGLAELVRVVRAHGAAIVAAHPFRWGQDFAGIVKTHGPVFDALELVSNNVSPETRRRTERLVREHRLGATGSSDAHDTGTIGCYFTEFPGPIETMADFVAALRQRTGRPRHRADAWLASGPVE
jgi:predicted metal-dependent phosphoesterase TrpH